MNEKLREFALEAGGSHYPEVNPMQLKKFAELIIRECADIAMREDHDPAECIKKHFGVE
jgi:hypothetical protein